MSDTWCLWVLKQDKVTFGRGLGSLVSHECLAIKKNETLPLTARWTDPAVLLGFVT